MYRILQYMRPLRVTCSSYHRWIRDPLGADVQTGSRRCDARVSVLEDEQKIRDVIILLKTVHQFENNRDIHHSRAIPYR